MAAIGQIDLNSLARLEFRAGGHEGGARHRGRHFNAELKAACHERGQSKTFAALNDLFRLNFFVPSFGPRPVPGHIVCTRGISALPPEAQISIWGEVSGFNNFDGG